MPTTTDPPYVEAENNGQEVRVLLDTGGGSSIITERMANKLSLKFFGIPNCVPPLRLKTVSNTFVSKETYHAKINLKLAHQYFDHRIFILCGMKDDTIIIGNEFLKKHDIWIRPKNLQVCFVQSGRSASVPFGNQQR